MSHAASDESGLCNSNYLQRIHSRDVLDEGGSYSEFFSECVNSDFVQFVQKHGEEVTCLSDSCSAC